jgi:hypothetical protein
MMREKYQLSLALHGHLHRPLLYNFNDVQVISATTATRVDKSGKTGFFLIKVLDTGTIRAEHHVWTGVDYTPDPDQNLSRDVGYSLGTPSPLNPARFISRLKDSRSALTTLLRL